MTSASESKSKHRPIWIAVFGPDGAGKTAVIEQATLRLGSVFCQIIQFHFRPDFGRSQRNRQPVTDPHGQSPRTLLVSISKLIYWLLDCWYGYLISVRASRASSRLVIFDRYYPDILIDDLRYRLPRSVSQIANLLVHLAPRPDLCILLDAPAEVVQSRKPEVAAAESERQRRAYLEMFGRIDRSLVLNANCPVEQIADQLCAAVLALRPTSRFPRAEVLLNANL